MIVDHFTKLLLCPESRDVFLLGYPLKLTDSEYAIVAYLSSSGSRTASRDELCELCGEASLNVHISNINKKANDLSDRKLIVFDGKNYKINENI